MTSKFDLFRDRIEGSKRTSAVHCFTSFNFSYLDRARVMAETVRHHNPHWNLWALIVDRPPEEFSLELDDEPFDFIEFASELELPHFERWIFEHNVVEACTAVKGPFAKRLLDGGAQKVVYLDPDIAAFSSLEEIETLLDSHDLLLTPHQLEPDDMDHAIVDNEICSLKHGAYNLGFFALRAQGDGVRFASWWAERLLRYCRDDIPGGLFTDQKWCDLVPCFFPGTHIVRDPGWNVASWNLSRREISFTAAGQLTVNGSPLRFFHFTKLGPVGDTMTTRYANDRPEVFELWSWYTSRVLAHRDPRLSQRHWKYGIFADGTPIQQAHRITYRNRADLRRAFPSPFDAGPGSFAEWFSANAKG
jgi:hypothetical protein